MVYRWITFFRDSHDNNDVKIIQSRTMSMQNLTEEDIKLRYITPSIVNRGWSVQYITMETKGKLTDGKINH